MPCHGMIAGAVAGHLFGRRPERVGRTEADGSGSRGGIGWAGSGGKGRQQQN